MKHSKRLCELDALRGLAALSVVLFHYTSLYDKVFGHEKTPYLLNFKYGYLGVHLFFIISGFVIYMTILKCNTVKEFIIKRITRLYPAYVTGVILTFTCIFFFGLDKMHHDITNAMFNLTMFQDIIPNTGFTSIDGSYWSLAVEMYFYLVCCVLFVFGMIKKPVTISIFTYLCLFVIQILFNMQKIHPFIGDHVLVHFSNLFIAGIMFYKIRENNHLKYNLVLLLSLIYQFVFYGFFTGIVISLFFGIFYALINNRLKLLNFKPLIFLGNISYSLYLIHQSIGFIIIYNIEKLGLISEVFILIPVLISIILATLITYKIEIPIQNFIRLRLIQKEKDKHLRNVVSL